MMTWLKASFTGHCHIFAKKTVSICSFAKAFGDSAIFIIWSRKFRAKLHIDTVNCKLCLESARALLYNYLKQAHMGTYRASVKTALFLTILAFLYLYISTAFPSFKNNDSPETAASAYTLSIPHPPGYPLINLAGKAAITLLPAGNPAFRMNIFSSFLAAGCLLLFYLIIKQNLSALYNRQLRAEIFAIAGAALLGTSLLFWNQATEAKGSVYMMNLFFTAALVLIWVKAPGRRLIYLSSFIYGLSLSNHWPSTAVLLPVYLYYIYTSRPGPGQIFIHAALLAAEILATSDDALAAKLEAMRQEMAAKVEVADAKLKEGRA